MIGVVEKFPPQGGGAIVVGVEEHFDDPDQLCARFTNGDPVISYIPAAMIGLIGHMCACRLLEQGCDPKRELIVTLVGADHELLRAPLGCAAAKPLVNYAEPVSEPMSLVYRRRHFNG